MRLRSSLAAAALTTATLGGGILAAAPAQAAPVLVGNLVAVNVSDVDVSLLDRADVRILNNVLNDNVVGVAVVAQVAAVVCDVNAAVLLAAVADTGTATCEAGNQAGDIVFTVVP